tara:strand:+ start:222 stop:1037 length:816 start_codon:yes stop_codon:yes gene_type:complete
MYEEQIILKGKKPGNKSLILVGVHGNEKCGINAIEKILPTLKIESGEIIIMYGSPEAIIKNVRYVEANLNRMFKKDEEISQLDRRSLEFKRSRKIMESMKNVDVLLDVHASNNPNSMPFIICENNAKDIILNLGIKNVIYGFDTIEPGGTDYYMNNIGKIGICVECGYANDPNSDTVAEMAIMKFLIAQGHISGINQNNIIKEMRVDNLYLTKSNSFILEKNFADFEKISLGQKIGIDGDVEIFSKYDGFILFAHNTDFMGAEAFITGKYL